MIPSDKLAELCCEKQTFAFDVCKTDSNLARVE